jgi:chromosome segregation ATPase
MATKPVIKKKKIEKTPIKDTSWDLPNITIGIFTTAMIIALIFLAMNNASLTEKLAKTEWKYEIEVFEHNETLFNLNQTQMGINNLTFKYKLLQHELNNLTAELKRSISSFENLSTDYNTLNARFDGKVDEIESLEETIEKKQSKINSINAKLAAKDDRIDSLNETIDQLQSELDACMNESGG